MSIKRQRNEYADTLSFLQRLNTAVMHTPAFHTHFMYEGYDLWATWQQALFEDIKRFIAGETRGEKQNAVGVKEFLMGILLVGISLIGACFLILSRRKTVLYAIDKVNGCCGNDARMDGVYQFLKKKHYSFFEFFHTIPGKKTLQYLVQRKRGGVYLEALDFLAQWGVRKDMDKLVEEVSLNAFTHEEERAFITALLTRYAQNVSLFRFRVRTMRLLFRLSGVKQLLAIDDVRQYHALLIAAQKERVHTYAFQHGHFTKYHIGWLSMEGARGSVPRPERLFVWSQYWKDELLRLGTYFDPSEIRIGGISAVPSYNPRRDGAQKKGLHLLIPYETVAPKREVIAYLNAFRLCPNATLYFKARSDVPVVSQLEEYGLANEKGIVVTTDVHEVLNNITVVVGTYSTFLYDMMVFAVPVVLLKTALDYGEGMARNNLADMVDIHRNDVCTHMLHAAQIPPKELQARKNKLFGENPMQLSDTLQRLNLQK